MNDDRFDLLVGRHLDRTLDAAGRKELAAALKTDAGRRRDYLRLLEQEELLVSSAREALTPSARIEAAHLPRRTRRLHRRTRIRTWTTNVAWLAAAFVLLVVGALVMQPGLRSPIGVEVVGDALVERAGTPVAPGRLQVDDVVTARGTAQLRLSAGGVVDVSPSTRVVVRLGTDGALDLRLDQGEVACDLPAQTRGFRITTAETVVAVVGTRFSVRAGAAISRVMVEHGRVRMRAAGGEVLLATGEQAEITAAGIRRAAQDVPARLTDADHWRATGTLTAQAGEGRATLAPAPSLGRDQWSGRAWTWHAPLPSDAAIALQARFSFPAATDGVWHGEVFLAPPDAHQDAEEAQPSPCLRLAVRSGIPTMVRRTTPEADPEVLWTGDKLPAGPRVLRLELVDGQVSARIDAQVVWKGALPFTSIVPGIRWTRRAPGKAPMVIDQVALESLLPP